MKSDLGTNNSRFGFLRSTGECPHPLYDRVLFEVDGCLVTPTLGSLLPNWVLITPRMPMTNFAKWQDALGKSPFDVAANVLDRVNSRDARVLLFEHGPAESGSVLGCGVDQAHLHLILDAPFSADDLRQYAASSARLDWKVTDARTVYQEVGGEGSYLIVGDEERAGYVQHVDRVGSQFLRRMIAHLVRRPETWNYRTHPYIENVERTVQTFALRMRRGDRRVRTLSD